MSYIEKLGPEQVLEAMRAMGWEPGRKPPTYVDIQAKCRALFENGGDGNRVKSLREQAITLALRESGAQMTSAADTTPPPRLPEELQNEIEGLASDISRRLNAFDRAAATYLDHNRSEVEAAANARVSAIRKETTQQSAALDDEITAALSAIESRDATIADLETRLSAALTAAAHADGRASALADQVAAQETKIRELQQGLKVANAGSKPSEKTKQEKLSTTRSNNAGKAASSAQIRTENPAESEDSSIIKPAPLHVVPQTGGNE